MVVARYWPSEAPSLKMSKVGEAFSTVTVEVVLVLIVVTDTEASPVVMVENEVEVEVVRIVVVEGFKERQLHADEICLGDISRK